MNRHMMGFSLPHHGSPHRNPKRPRPPVGASSFFGFDYIGGV